MSVPKFTAFFQPVLNTCGDGEIKSLQFVREYAKDALHLSKEDIEEVLPSGKQLVYHNRAQWAATYLKKAGLLTAPKRGHLQITAEGKRVLQSGRPVTMEVLEEYPTFVQFHSSTGVQTKAVNPVTLPSDTNIVKDTNEDTPSETLERVFHAINEQLADDLITAIMGLDSYFFEKLVVDLMRAMNYGDGFRTKASNDGGIDGIIPEDKLGFNLIYVQAKRWDPETVISKPEIQKFAGAMMGPPRIEKGLFITTAKFSKGAKEFADAQHIILVDGKRLTELMIEYNLGVSMQKAYMVKRIDSDYFSEE